MLSKILKNFNRFSSNKLINKFRGCITGRQGGYSSIPVQAICNYANRLKNTKNTTYTKAVQKFKDTIEGDPMLRVYFNDEVLQRLPIRQGGRILGDSAEQAYQLINTAITSPPKFEDREIVGVPIYALFCDYLESQSGQVLFSKNTANQLLKDLFKQYADLLGSPKSLQYIKGWLFGKARDFWDPSQYLVDLNDKEYMGFQNWHQFFLRRFRQEARPIAKGEDVIASVCQSYPLTDPKMPVRNVKLKDYFWLKDNRYSLIDMVGKKQENDLKDFQDGTVFQAFLNPWTYHRWHAPVDGQILDAYHIPGSYYLQNPGLEDPNDNQQNYINSQPFLTCTSTRLVFKIKANNPRIGNMYVIMVGMAEVSSCKTALGRGDSVKKGEEIGHFQFGGSSHCIIFNKNCDLDFKASLNHNYQNDTDKKFKINVRSQLARLKSKR